jgi:hypothetical protein
MPGLINAHLHSPANLLKGAMRDMPLELFMLYEVPPIGDTPSSARLYYLRSMLGAMEMLKLGITSVHDDAFSNPTPFPETIDAVMHAYRDAGIRATVICPGYVATDMTAKETEIPRHDMTQPGDLAEMACELEIGRLGRPIGKQDQYIAAYGGITCFHFDRDGTVHAEPLQVASTTLHALEDNLMLFFTGFSRSAGDILQDQDSKTRKADAGMIANLDYIKDLGHRSRKALEGGAPAEFGALMHEHWEQKRKRSSGMSNARIDEWYELGRQSGAVGGKLVGAGGGGFLMFYAEDKAKLRHAMRQSGLKEVRFRFDFEGTKLVIS